MKKYVIGIDAGAASVGLAAIEVDDANNPLDILVMTSVIHDSGISLEGRKTAETRKKIAGTARRARNLISARKKRLRAVDDFLREKGWLTDSPNWDELINTTYAPWYARSRLATEYISDVSERNELFVLALRHIARHRGWRNPYTRVETLCTRGEDSGAMSEVRARIEKDFGRKLDDKATVGQLMAAVALRNDVRIRPHNRKGEIKKSDVAVLMPDRLEQKDYANEILAICEKQCIHDDVAREIIKKIFHNKEPRAHEDLIGKDPLPGMHKFKRAHAASESYQQYRIAVVIANMKITDAPGLAPRPLDPIERGLLFKFLNNRDEKATWEDVARFLKTDPTMISGSGATVDGEYKASQFPNINETTLRMKDKKTPQKIREFWLNADQLVRDEFIRWLDLGFEGTDSPAAQQVNEFIASLDEKDLLKLDDLDTPKGRAAYSLESLRKITEFILASTESSERARNIVFFDKPDYQFKMPVDPISTPVNNPAVDRALVAVEKFLQTLVHEYGPPQRVVIEHVREGFISESMKREMLRENQRRFTKKLERYEDLGKKLSNQKISRTDLSRYEMFTRQGGVCLYCGEEMDISSSQIDHIVPRSGPGSTNIKSNLVLVHGHCNREKSNEPFGKWIARKNPDALDEVISRVKFWIDVDNLGPKKFKKFQDEVIARLQRKDTDSFDDRSIESTAWMARALAARVEGFLYRQHLKHGMKNPTDQTNQIIVPVYRGEITAQARKAAKINGAFNTYKSPPTEQKSEEELTKKSTEQKKSRFDRRHHAIDAAVIALMTPTVAKIMGHQLELKKQASYTNFSHDSAKETKDNREWEKYYGSTEGEKQTYASWLDRMQILKNLINDAIDHDQVSVTRSIRLKLGDGSLHDDTIKPFVKKPLGSYFSLNEIDRVSSQELWKILTTQKDYDPKNGLPENPLRQIILGTTVITAQENINLFPGDNAMLAVRGGGVDIGNSIHHARIYKITKKNKTSYGMLRVFSTDLRNAKGDLFSHEIEPCTISFRTATDTVKKAILENRAEYLGWIVTNDEIVLHKDSPIFADNMIGEFMQLTNYSGPWVINGLSENDTLKLRPSYLAGEGLTSDNKVLKKIIIDKGWRASVNRLFHEQPKIIRRTSTGAIRNNSHYRPGSWDVT